MLRGVKYKLTIEQNCYCCRGTCNFFYFRFPSLVLVPAYLPMLATRKIIVVPYSLSKALVLRAIEKNLDWLESNL